MCECKSQLDRIERDLSTLLAKVKLAEDIIKSASENPMLKAMLPRF